MLYCSILLIAGFIAHALLVLTGLLLLLFGIIGMCYYIHIIIIYGVWCWLPYDMEIKLTGIKFKWIVYGIYKKYYDKKYKTDWWKMSCKKFILISEKHAIKKLKEIKNKIGTDIFVIDLTFNKENEELKELFCTFPYRSSNYIDKKFDEIFINEKSSAINKEVFDLPAQK